MRRSLSGFTVAVVLALPQVVWAQTREITGTVTVAGTNQPLPDVTVSIVGTNAVTRSGPQGTFRLAGPAGPVTVAARAIGYKRVTTPLPAGQNTVNFSLERDVLQLEGVVVTGAATTQERRNVSTAVSVVSAEEVSRVPAASLDNALQGKVVGANINMNSGAPGGGGQVQIRGVTSILGNGEPLYVVDGVIISNAAVSTGINAVQRASGSAPTSNQDNAVNRLADINPNDIASIQVLKSAAATAIYGSKATNGVILITTKRGESGQPRFGITQRVGTYQATRLLGSRRFTPETALEVLTPAQVAQYCPNGTCPHYDYQGELYGQTDLSYETIATLSGGSQATRYYVSAAQKDDKGTQINSDARRQSLRLNLDHNLGERWTLNVSASLSRSETNRGLSNNDNSGISPIYAFGYTPALVDLATPDENGVYRTNPFQGGGGANASNPFQTLRYMRNYEDVWRQIGSASVRFNAFTNDQHTLTFNANGGFDRFDGDAQVYSPNFLQFEPADGLLGTSGQGEALSRNVNGTLGAVHTFAPSASGMFGFVTSLTTSAGFQVEERSLNRFNVTARGLVPGIDLIDQGTPQLFHNKQVVRDQAFYLNEEILAFDERLSVSARVRGERSSVNGDRDQFYYWPAASASYRLVNLFPYADEIKLRAAFGTSGNQANYGNRDVVLAGLGIIDGRVAIGVPTSIGNAGIKPEKMTEQEFGVDAAFADGRVGLEFSYFDRTISDLLLTAQLAPTSGFASRFINGGELATIGTEAALTVVPVRTGTLTWSARAQFSTFNSWVNNLPEDVGAFAIGSSGFGAQYGRGRIAEGYRSTLIWGNRIREDGSVVDTVLADANPDFQMQFSNDVMFRDFSLSFLFDWRKGGYVSNMTQSLFDEGENSWDYDHPSPDPNMPLGLYRYTQWARGTNAGVIIQDGSYVKLREVTLSYAVPQSLVGRINARDVRLSLSGRNLVTWTDYWGPDPEVNNFGNQNVVRFVDLAPYPPTRSFFLGVDVGF